MWRRHFGLGISLSAAHAFERSKSVFDAAVGRIRVSAGACPLHAGCAVGGAGCVSNASTAAPGISAVGWFDKEHVAGGGQRKHTRKLAALDMAVGHERLVA